MGSGGGKKRLFMLRNAGGVGLLGGVWRPSKGTRDYIDAGNREDFTY